MFRYRVKNIFGWGPYSNEVSTISATIPDAPSSPTTSNIGISVMIQWNAPYNGGSVILNYNV